MSCSPSGASSVADVAHHRARRIRAGEAEPGRREDAAIRLDRQHVLLGLLQVRIAIAVAAAQAVLFVGEEHDADGATRPDPELLHQPRRLPRHDAPDAIV